MTANRIAAFAITAVFAITVIVGLYLAGSPAEQRLVTLDNRRVSDLRQLSNSIRNYWRDHQTLPDRLDARAVGYGLTSIPTDPETSHPYEYEPTAENAYRLCADFSRQSTEPTIDEFWRHDAGRHCFVFELAESKRQ